MALFVGLALACFLLARKGAEWFLAEEAAADKDQGTEG
jgi:hypothetical protein